MTRWRLSATLLLAATAVMAWLWWFSATPEEPVVEPETADYAVSRVIRFGFKLRNQSTHVLHGATLWAYGPVGLSPTQRVDAVETEVPVQVVSDELGNQVFNLEVGTIPPRGARDIQLLVRMSLATRPNRTILTHPGIFLGHSALVQSDAPAIRQLAQTLKAATATQTAKNSYDWVADNIRYTGYARSARGALYALRMRQGDCTEFAMLFVALMRTNGLPARVIGGFVTDEDRFLRARDYHNWAEFYLDGHWHVADPQRRVFMRGYNEYIAFRIDGLADEQRRVERFGVEPSSLLAVMN